MAAVAASVLALTGCAPSGPQLVEGSSLSVASAEPFTSYNPLTRYGDTAGNRAIAAATNAGFFSYDDVPELVRDESFGHYEVVSESPLVIQYTIADGVRWSDGTPVDAVDLLLHWAALSGALDTPGFEAAEHVDPDTGLFRDDFPKDVVYFDSGSDPDHGLGLVRDVPIVSEDRKTLTLAYREPFADWELQLTSPMPAHVIAERALGSATPDEAKQAVLDAIRGKDRAALAKLSAFWNSGFTLAGVAEDPGLLVGSGPYVVAEVVPDQSVTLRVNENYVGDRRPQFEEIVVRFLPDPLGAVQALQNGNVQIIAPQATREVATALAGTRATVIAGTGGFFEHLDLQVAQSKSGVFADPRVREAFLKTIPRQEIVEALIDPIAPGAQVRDSFVFLPGTAEYAASVAGNGSKAFAEPDIAGAQALLAAAGASSPEVCILYAAGNPRRTTEFQLIQASAAEAGFAVTDCSSPEWRELRGTPGAYDAAIYAWEVTGLGVTALAPPVFGTEGLNNFTFYSEPRMDALLKRLESALDRQEQAAILAEVDALAFEQALGLPLFQYPALVAYDPAKVTGVSFGPLSPGVFWNVWEWAPPGAPS